MTQGLKSTVTEREGQDITHCRSYFYKRQAARFEVDIPNIKRHTGKKINMYRPYVSNPEEQSQNLISILWLLFWFLVCMALCTIEGCAFCSGGSENIVFSILRCSILPEPHWSVRIPRSLHIKWLVTSKGRKSTEISSLKTISPKCQGLWKRARRSVFGDWVSRERRAREKWLLYFELKIITIIIIIIIIHFKKPYPRQRKWIDNKKNSQHTGKNWSLGLIFLPSPTH